jgi:tRNA(Met) C34 N-acetyltransferase TmcA
MSSDPAVVADEVRAQVIEVALICNRILVTLTKISEEGSAFPERIWTMESDRRPSRRLVIWSLVANR